MAYTPFTDPIDHIANLSDRPNDTDGMTAQALKAAFDQGFADAQEYINDTLIPQLNAEQARLDQAIADIESIEAGELTEGSVKEINIDTGAVTVDKIHENAVTAPKILNGAVNADKIDSLSIEHRHFNGRVVNSDNLMLGAVDNNALGTGAVHTNNIDDGAVTTAKLDGGAVTYAKTSGIQKKHSYISYVTLTPSGWDSSNKQTVDASGVTASNLVLTAPWVANTDNGNWVRCRDNGIRCIVQGDGTLTFQCDTKPASNAYISVAIFD